MKCSVRFVRIRHAQAPWRMFQLASWCREWWVSVCLLIENSFKRASSSHPSSTHLLRRNLWHWIWCVVDSSKFVDGELATVSTVGSQMLFLYSAFPKPPASRYCWWCRALGKSSSCPPLPTWCDEDPLWWTYMIDGHVCGIMKSMD